MHTSKSIFRAYDIRGTYGETLKKGDVAKIASAFVQFCQVKCCVKSLKIIVGRDGRLSSPEIAQTLIDGLRSKGADVIDVGVGPTPLLYFAAAHLKPDAAIMVTGSHNAPDINGFKMMVAGQALYGDQIQELYQIICHQENDPSSMCGEGQLMKTNQGFSDVQEHCGTLQMLDLQHLYVDALLKDIKLAQESRNKVKIAWDPGNGAAGDVLAKLIERLPGEHFLINQEIDGAFPAHHPDPACDENLEQLRALVQNKRCDLGFAFDGDGDRIRVLMPSGAPLSNDHAMMLFAENVLASKPGAAILADVKTSEIFFRHVRELGGDPILSRTGYSYIKKQMRENSCILFAGEMSGHLFFKDRYFGFDDGIYAALRFLELAVNADKSPQERVETYPVTVSSSELKLKVNGGEKFEKIEAIKNIVQEEGVVFCDLDGVRITQPKGWLIIRASNTEDIIVCRYEAYDAKDEEELQQLLNRYLSKIGLNL